MDFIAFKKIPRLSRDMVITEKLDGTNGQIYIINKIDFEDLHPNCTGDSVEAFKKQFCLYEKDDVYIFAGSRNRWITPDKDNYGFAKWVKENAEELFNLGEGHHYGEWYGQGIQRNYGLQEKRFALFNTHRWCQWDQNPKLISVNPKTGEEKYQNKAPKCCDVVPVLYEGEFNTAKIEEIVEDLKKNGSAYVPGFMNPEGVVVFHSASGQLFKKTCLNDEKPKGNQ